MYFNDEDHCRQAQMNKFREERPIYDIWEKAAKRLIKELWK